MSIRKIVLIVIICAVLGLALAVDMGKQKRDKEAPREKASSTRVEKPKPRENITEQKKAASVENKKVGGENVVQTDEMKRSTPTHEKIDPFAGEPSEEEKLSRKEYVKNLLARIPAENTGELRTDILGQLTKEELEDVWWEERQRERVRRGLPRESRAERLFKMQKYNEMKNKELFSKDRLFDEN